MTCCDLVGEFFHLGQWSACCTSDTRKMVPWFCFMSRWSTASTKSRSNSSRSRMLRQSWSRRWTLNPKLSASTLPEKNLFQEAVLFFGWGEFMFLEEVRKMHTPLWNQDQRQAGAGLGKHPSRLQCCCCLPPPPLSLFRILTPSPAAAASLSSPSIGHFWTSNLRTKDGWEEDKHHPAAQPFCLLSQKKQRVGIVPAATGRISIDPPFFLFFFLVLVLVLISLFFLSSLFLSCRE